jgi:hypothetical protein
MRNEECGMRNGEFKGVGTVADSTGYPVSFTEKNYPYLSAYGGRGESYKQAWPKLSGSGFKVPG